ncbi:MAG: sugar ABC transporter ATP-binding protein [Spirochaetaceae bacterium]|nr:MAG: sugar ABC transporter ATP-binding protein [Spirochaetaceae bacterium]
MQTATDEVLTIRGLSKSYGGVHALDEVSLDVRRGEVHAIIGENGAGKSTLVKIISGVVQRDSGSILMNGESCEFRTPREAIENGISIIHQELSMLPHMTVIENIYTGRMASRAGVIDWKQMEEKTRRALNLVEKDIDPYARVGSLSISDRQMVEIAKAVDKNCRILIMDEPNSSLSEHESEVLFRIIRRIKNEGIAVIYISHKLEEVMLISDRITALRDGKYVGTVPVAETTLDGLVKMMVGRDLVREEIRRSYSSVPALEVRGLTGKRYRDVSFTLYRGEILGFSGLVGAGRSEVARGIFGADQFESGKVLLKGQTVRFRTPRDAIEGGVAMLPEDRKVLSLFMDLSIRTNMALAHLPHLARRGVIRQPLLAATVQQFVDRLRIRMDTLEHPVKSLSGGNQQKTIIGRWLATRPEVLILDEPTHGVDVGAKAEIYQMIRALADDGMSIILISSELPEIIAMSDRVVVMREGRVTATLDHQEIDEETIMNYAAGGMVRKEEIEV